MDFRQTLSAELPPLRDNESPSLRQDILDELADHLDAACKRELLRGVDVREAQARVLERFGDPAAVARQLWLDAMKGKIMLQRTVVATCLAMMAICVSFTGFAWVQMNRATAAAEVSRARAAVAAELANRRVSEAIAASQATNKELLGQIRLMSESLRRPRSPDWNRFRMKLTRERLDGPPVTNAIGSMNRLGENPKTTLSRNSDRSGIVDFGLVPPGDYQFEIKFSWAGGSEEASGRVNVQLGSDVLKTVICPKTPTDRAPVTVRCKWPADLEAKNVVLCADLVHRFQELEPGVHWISRVLVVRPAPMLNKKPKRATVSWYVSPERAILCGPGQQSTAIQDQKALFVWADDRFDPLSPRELREAMDRRPAMGAEVLEENLETGPGTTRFETGSYALTKLLALRPSMAEDVPTGRRRYEVLAAGSARGYFQGIEFVPQPPTDKQLDSTFLAQPDPGPPRGGVKSVAVPADFWKDTVFEARPDRPNNWTIPIPDELIKAVRDRLTEDPAPQSKSATKNPQSKP